MKEMNWTREEVLKRLAIMLQNSEKCMKEEAADAVLMLTDEAALEKVKKAREIKSIAVGISAAADALGISLEELRDLEVDADEAEQFVQERNNELNERMKKRTKNRVNVVEVDEMPDELKEILKSILD